MRGGVARLTCDLNMLAYSLGEGWRSLLFFLTQSVHWEHFPYSYFSLFSLPWSLLLRRLRLCRDTKDLHGRGRNQRRRGDIGHGVTSFASSVIANNKE